LATPHPRRGTPPHPTLHPSPVADAVRHAAERPNRTAVVDGDSGESLSHHELAETSAALATKLERSGVGRGDFVAIAMPNSGSWAVAALAVWRAGAVVVPISPLWTADETARTVVRVPPRLAITTGDHAPVLHRALAAAGIAPDVITHLTGPHPDDPLAPPGIAHSDLAAILFSSGLGGLPKGARLTHGNLAAMCRYLATSLDLGPDSVSLAGAPVFHVMGLGMALCTPLSVGARIVTAPVPRAERLVELIAAHRITHATLPPTAVAEIAAGAAAERDAATHLKYVVTGGDTVPAADQLRAGERLGGATVRQAYGMTEALGISGPLGVPSDPETVGWPGPETELRVIDPGGGHEVESGQPGELWLRSPQVMDGYHDNPEATAEMLTPDGWLRTGDLVMVRADGQIVIKDRIKELIKVKGASVAPAELELVLHEHPSVRESLVVGRPDAGRGEVPVAWVVLSTPASTDELLEFVRGREVRQREREAAVEATRDAGASAPAPR
jgi:acyl-CoA synthetase (AMP-forming)/AMP-acid ligase II